MSHEPEDVERLSRWAASLRRTSIATREEAERHGQGWDYYDLSVASSEAQDAQAEAMERELDSRRRVIARL